MFSWKFDEAFAIINSWDEIKNFDALILKARLFNHQGKFDDALDSVNAALALAEEREDDHKIFHGHAIKSNILMKLGKMQEAAELFQTWDHNIQQSSPEFLNETKWSQGYLYNYYGVFKGINGDIQNAILTFKKALKIQEEIDDKHGLATVRQNIGYFYKTMGEFGKALTEYDKSREHYNDLNYSYGIAMVLSNIGDLLRLQGKLVESKDHLLKAIEIFLQVKGNPNPHVIAFTYRRIGQIHLLLNDLEHARWNYDMAVESIVDGGSAPITFAELSFDQIFLAIEEGNEVEEQKWLSKLRTIQEENPDNKMIDLHLKFINALILLKSLKRLKEIVEAEKSLQEIIDGEIISHEITVLAMIHYLEILFIEMRVIQDEDIIKQIIKYMRKIFEIATSQESVALMIELHILNAKIALLTLNSSEIADQLELAEKLAVKHDIVILIEKVEKEKKYANNYIARYDKMVEDQSSITSRIDEVNILSYLNDVSKIVRS